MLSFGLLFNLVLDFGGLNVVIVLIISWLVCLLFLFVLYWLEILIWLFVLMRVSLVVVDAVLFTLGLLHLVFDWTGIVFDCGVGFVFSFVCGMGY